MARILLVEDQSDVRVLLEHVLLGSGYDADAAATLSEGRALLAANAYDLVIADARLADGSGVALADEAKQRGVRTLVITGYALRPGMEGLNRHPYLLKPVRPSELLLALRRLIGEI